jgi:hypothetical protein
MITVLAVGERDGAEKLDRLAARDPSLELLHAADVEETVERLARNRRIDAVLLLVGAEAAREIARTVLEEDPAGPPMFVPAATGEIDGVRPLAATTPEELLRAIVRDLSA